MIHLEVNQKGLRGGQCLPAQVLKDLGKAASRGLKIRAGKVVSVAFVSEREIKKLNKRYRKKEAVTDVLSFPFSDGEEAGEILICYKEAKRQAKLYKTSTRVEVILLIVHGLLHIFDHHHKTKQQEKEMRALTQKIMKSLSLPCRL
jgi:probable rRNA maturation factor